jgi:hypothetical protein
LLFGPGSCNGANIDADGGVVSCVQAIEVSTTNANANTASLAEVACGDLTMITNASVECYEDA